MKKRIGILGGISHESTLKYYELIHRKYYEKYQDHYYPEIVLFSFDFQKFTDFEDSGDLRGYVSYIEYGVKSLEKAAAEKMKKLLLLGIKFTMQSSFYKKVCEKYGIEVIVPAEKEQDDINGIVFNELVGNKITEKSRRILIEIINRYPVDGVILGCIELPLTLKQEDLSVPLLNTLDLNVEAALDYAVPDADAKAE